MWSRAKNKENKKKYTERESNCEADWDLDSGQKFFVTFVLDWQNKKW